VAVILLYHGVTDYKGYGIENYSGKHIDANEFYRQMTILHRDHRVMGLSNWLHSRDDDAVIITFDDSYEDVYVNAFPILRDYGLPAVFYVTAGMVNTDLMYWTDRIECCLNYTTRRKVMGLPTRTTEERREAAILLKARGKVYCKQELRCFTDLVTEASDVEPAPSLCDHYRNISWRQLREMEDNGIEIGGHGLYHDILGHMEPEEQDAEIQTTKGLLQANLWRPVTQFSYPEGQDGHFNDNTIYSLKRYGFTASPTAIDGVNDRTTDPFHLRRVMVGFNGIPFPF